MERVFDRVVGLDVHKDTVVACVRLPRGEGGRTAETATFGTTTADLTGCEVQRRRQRGHRPVRLGNAQPHL